MTEKIPIEVLAHYGGNVSDNANDALLEGNLIFQKIMTKVNESKENLPLTDTVFGVTSTAKKKLVFSGISTNTKIY